MEYNYIAEFINSVGFPIFVSCVLLWQSYKATQKHNEAYGEFKNAITGNTEIINQMLTSYDTMNEYNVTTIGDLRKTIEENTKVVGTLIVTVQDK